MIKIFFGYIRRTRNPGPAWHGARGMASEKEWSSSQAGVLEFLDPKGGAGSGPVGRPWLASELRLKSTEDLQKLWYVLIKERTILDIEKQWCDSNGQFWEGGRSRLRKVRTSMSRIKCVVGERIRLYGVAKKYCRKHEEYIKLFSEINKADERKFPFSDPLLEEIIRWEFSMIGKSRRNRIILANKKRQQRMERELDQRRAMWLNRQRASVDEEDFGDDHPLARVQFESFRKLEKAEKARKAAAMDEPRER